MEKLICNPLFLVAITIVFGQMFGKIGVRYFKLGNSGVLFVGLFLSYILGSMEYGYIIPKELFFASLIGFIVTVGLKASKNIVEVISTYGLKFIILALVITMTGALSSFAFLKVLPELKLEIIGTYIGSLTSSPGLATALEAAPLEAGSFIGLGYAIAYIPGVVLVILFSQISARNKAVGETTNEASNPQANQPFDVVRFLIVIVVGIAIGSIKLGTALSLGMTGGVLLSALVMGAMSEKFTFSEASLSPIRDISLSSFLAIVGLKYGFQAVNAIQESGLQLLIIGLTTAVLSISSGYLVGKYLLRIEHVILVGGICGGMTSTPGLAAATKAFEDDRVVAGYGATYPIALLGMIIFANLLF